MLSARYSNSRHSPPHGSPGTPARPSTQQCSPSSPQRSSWSDSASSSKARSGVSPTGSGSRSRSSSLSGEPGSTTSRSPSHQTMRSQPPLKALSSQATATTAAGVAAYDRAIKAHEDFATAYTGRARARLLAANPDYPVTRAFTDPGGSDTAAAVRDAQRALDLGGHRDLLGEALLALVAFYRGDYDQAISGADAAIKINPDVPDVWLLKSAAQLALGDSRRRRHLSHDSPWSAQGKRPIPTHPAARRELSQLSRRRRPRQARTRGRGATILDPCRRHRNSVHASTETPDRRPSDRQRRGHRPEIRKRTTEPRHPLARSPSRHSAQRDRVRTAARKRGLDTATRPRALRHRPRDRHAPNQRATVANMQTNRRQGGHLSQRGAATLNDWPRRHADLLTRVQSTKRREQNGRDEGNRIPDSGVSWAALAATG